MIPPNIAIPRAATQLSSTVVDSWILAEGLDPHNLKAKHVLATFHWFMHGGVICFLVTFNDGSSV